MKRILKYQLPIDDNQKISCTAPLSVIEQNDEIMLYVIDDPEQNRDYIFKVVGTGRDLEGVGMMSHMKFLGTVKSGLFVWHVLYRPARISV